MKDSEKVVIGVLAGLVVGAALGILFAPDKGSETRKKLAAEGEQLKDNFEEQFTNLLSELKSKFEAVKDDIEKT